MWAWVLMLPGNLGLFWLGALLGAGAAVWICGRAEQILGLHDPGSIVLDEIVAIPLCLGTGVTALAWSGSFTGPMAFVSAHPAWVVPAVFVAFRVVDIAKPWPVRQVQALPGGWGVVVDDVLAAVWVNVPWLLWLGWKPGCCGSS